MGKVHIYYASEADNHISDGAAKCEEENLWMLEWYDAGKLEINSTVCFVMDLSRQGLDSMNIIFTFYGLELIQILRFVKVRPG